VPFVLRLISTAIHLSAGLNAVESSQISLSSISENIQPIRIHFSPYRGKNVIKEVRYVLQSTH